MSPLKEIKGGCEVSCGGRGGVGVGRVGEEKNRLSENGADYAFGYRVGLELLCEGHCFCQTPQDRPSALRVIDTVTPPFTSEVIFFPLSAGVSRYFGIDRFFVWIAKLVT